MIILGLAAIGPLFMRVVFGEFGPEVSFGYFKTATHFRLDGLFLGVLAAFLAYHKPEKVRAIVPYTRPIQLTCFLFILALPHFPEALAYTLGYFLLAIGVTLLIMVAAMGEPWWGAGTKLTHVVAVTSYSVYLTHALVIQAVLRIMDMGTSIPPLVTWVMMISVIAAVGYIFYRTIEKTSIMVRDKIVPRRSMTEVEPGTGFVGPAVQALR